MCGIAGAINLTGRFNSGIIRGLAYANRERGTDSFGVFDTTGRYVKAAGDPSDCMAKANFRDFIDAAEKRAWAIGIHTRYATHGSVCDRNAHPFKYRHIIGTHNGMVHAPKSYAVDSEYLFDTIRRKGYKGLEDIDGYWGLAWYNKRTKEFYLTMHSGQLAYAVKDGVCYYSSDKDHLKCFMGDVHSMSEGQVLCFDANGNVLDSDQNQIAAINAMNDYYYGGYSGYSTGSRGCRTSGRGRSTYKGGTTSATCANTASYSSGDDEAEWRDSWGSYLHSMSDDDFSNWQSTGWAGMVD